MALLIRCSLVTGADPASSKMKKKCTVNSFVYWYMC